jgi:hypothetical protein
MLGPQRMAGEFPGHMRGFRISRLGNQRGPGFPMGWGYAPYVADYDPSEYASQYAETPYGYPPTENFYERGGPVMTYQPGCRTDVQKVRSETGGERSITITRCY